MRTVGQVHQVSRIAQQAAGKSLDEISPPLGNANEIIIQGTRPAWDRPRNERKVLQRIMQLLVLGGLHQYDIDHGSIDSPQYAIAAVLLLGSRLDPQGRPLLRIEKSASRELNVTDRSFYVRISYAMLNISRGVCAITSKTQPLCKSTYAGQTFEIT